MHIIALLGKINLGSQRGTCGPEIRVVRSSHDTEDPVNTDRTENIEDYLIGNTKQTLDTENLLCQIKSIIEIWNWKNLL